MVFKSFFVRLSIFALLGAFLLQPVVPVYANELQAESTGSNAVSAEEVEAEIVQEPEETIPVEPTTDVSEVEEAIGEDEQGVRPETNEEVPETTMNALVTSSSTELEALELSDDVFVSSTESVEVATSTESENHATTPHATTTETEIDKATTTASSTSSTNTVEEPHVDEDSVLPTENSDSASSTTSAETEEIHTGTTTEETTATTTDMTEMVTPSVAINDSNRRQFAVDQCVSVGNGAFYCSQPTTNQEFTEDGVYSAPDEDGDKEIYLRLGGEEVQITKNQIEDEAPYYDARSNTIVWHSMKHDRFQVTQYDLETKQTIYLTDTSYNNMEPVAYGDIVLWQAWIENNWEIMMYENGETTQLTHNDKHDVAPHMRDDHILWQTQFHDGWQIAVFDAKTRTVDYIAEGDGSRIENPRLVLVYDSTDENGDIKTVGYDFETKSTFALGNVPQELPEELPEPDQTGETRALIQNKSQQREVKSGEEDLNLNDSLASTTAATSTASTKADDVLTLDLSTSTSSSTSASSTVPHPIDNIPDVVVPPLSTSSSTEDAVQTIDIPDVVIPATTSTTSLPMG